MIGVIYCRYSPRPHESDSIRAQAEDLQHWCDEHGITPVVVCFDPDTSGTVGIFNRPGLRTALELLERDWVLVVRNLNRACRSVSVGLLLEEEIERIGAQLACSENGGLQATKAEDRNAWCLRVIQYLMSDMQRLEINDRTSRRMRQHQSAGRAMGGHAPYGWDKVGKSLVPCEDEQRTIALVVSLADRGADVREIASWLRRKGIPARGTRWHTISVRRILQRAKKGAPFTERASVVVLAEP